MRLARHTGAWYAALILVVLFGLTGLNACGTLPVGLNPQDVTPEQAVKSTPTPTLPPSGTVEAVTAIPPAPPKEMTIWLPPEFDPQGPSRAAGLLQERLSAFSREQGIQINVRLKASGGPGGMLESLSAASAAAPLALPSLAVLSRSDLETAALKGLLVPLEGATTALDNQDWFEYARQLAVVEDVPFGLPFAGDALLVVYRPAQVSTPPSTWESILNLGQPFAFSAASQQALATIALYRSLGGEIVDAQDRPVLQAEILADVLDIYDQGAAKGVFPAWLAQVDSDTQVWQVFAEGRVNAAISWSNQFLGKLPPDSTIAPLPAPNGGSFSLATGWVWAVSDPIPERRQLAVHLAEWLCDPDFLSAWTQAAGYLPTRPSALAGWRDGSLRTVLGKVAISARARPTNDLLSSLGPALRDATVSVIRLESDAPTAAATASQRISSPLPP